jgi:NDMA-dependent alcohol dehydrogenase
MKIKGGVLIEMNDPWTVEEIELGDPVAGEVQVRLAASGLCHSDEHVRVGEIAIPHFPFLGGHEGAGVVTKVGEGVRDLREGDHVVLAFIPACGKCLPCSKGKQNLCDLGKNAVTGESIADGIPRAKIRGKDAVTMCLLGTFAPYVTVHETSVIKIEDDIPLEVASLLGCGVCTGFGSAVVAAGVRPTDIAVVVGIGGVGINAVQGAAAAGAERVVAIDPLPFKREQALAFGATDVYESMDAAVEPLRDLTWGRMADKVILTVGTLEGGHIAQALALAGKNGRVVVTALGHHANRDVQLPLFELTAFEKEVRGAFFGGASPRQLVPEILHLYRKGRIKLDELVTRTYKHEELNQGYEDMLAGRNLRGLIRYTDADY